MNYQQPAEAPDTALGVQVAIDATMEIPMNDAQTETAATPATEAATKKSPAKKAPRPEKKAKSAKAAKATAMKKEKAPKPEKVKREKVPNDATRTFAIKISDNELAAIHKSCGPRNATRIVRALTVAFVNEDESLFRSLLKEARQARA